MRASLKMPLLMGAAVGLTSAAALVVTGGPAMASARNCIGTPHYDIPGSYYSYCSAGSGYYEAVAYCSANATQGSAFTYIFGATTAAGSGKQSIAKCPSNKKYLQGGYTAIL
jgi:hypothetical protein